MAPARTRPAKSLHATRKSQPRPRVGAAKSPKTKAESQTVPKPKAAKSPAATTPLPRTTRRERQALARAARQTLANLGARDQGTRDRILLRASEQFASHGYAATSIRELAQAAGVNLAAISYHFEGKEQLYRETLRFVLAGAEAFWTAARFRQREAERVGTRAAAEAALRQHIQEFVEMLFRHETAFTLMLREFLEPTAGLVQVVAELVGPNSAILQDLVEQLRPDLKGTQQLRGYCSSIIGQCVHLRVARTLIAHLQQVKELDEVFLRSAAATIAEFSMAALRPVTTVTSKASATVTNSGIESFGIESFGIGSSSP